MTPYEQFQLEGAQEIDAQGTDAALTKASVRGGAAHTRVRPSLVRTPCRQDDIGQAAC